MTQARTGPIDASWVACRKTSCDELTAASGRLWWLQSDPDLAGATRLFTWDGTRRPSTATPPDLELGGWLHAYGGGSYAVSDHGTWVVDANDSSVRLLTPDGTVRRVAGGDGLVYGDLHAIGHTVLAVREAHPDGDQIVELTPDGDVRVLVESAGFLSEPTVQGVMLAYVQWDADRMPWDSSTVRVASFTTLHHQGGGSVVAGSAQEAVTQPQWGPDGGLYFLSDKTGWWNLYRWDPDGTRRVFAIDRDCAPAPWEGGYRSFAFLPNGKIALTVHDTFRTRLVIVDAGGQATDLLTDLTSIKPYLAVAHDRLAVIGSSPHAAPSVQLINLAEPQLATTTALGKTRTPEPAPSPSVMQVRETATGQHGIRYLLRLPRDTGRRPMPVLVRAHPGPTDDVPMRLDWTAEFFTSRGYAVADVAYRGSTGQGRAFRQSLHQHWGQYDSHDCAAVATQLLADGLAMPGAIFISGSSAGGYTALKAACLTGPFAAATAASAIIDPHRWTATAPRFQRPHAAILAGPAGAVRAEDIRIPVLLIHGTDDAIAPFQDAQALAARLDARQADHEVLFLDGADHYLSDPRCREAALTAEADFYARFTPPTD
ncbi:MAG TPA: prolyl oligopeptidase family serine peptidase [Actinocrinis sp.]|nr:prolyl oligopeptidase family serine peptidase [Actinocrinis sp.]